MHFCSSSFLPTWNVCTVEIESGLHLWRLRMNAVGCQTVTKEKHYLKWRCTGRLCRTAIANEWESLSVAAMFDSFNVPSKHVLMRTILKRQINFQRQMAARICPQKEDLIPDPRDLERKKFKSTELCETQKQEVSGNLWIFRSTWRFKPIQIQDVPIVGLTLLRLHLAAFHGQVWKCLFWPIRDCTL